MNHQQNLKIKGTVSDLISSVNDSIEGSIKRSVNRPFIIVGIPAFNEEVAIGSMVLRARKYADKVIVIDDGSIDKTTDVAMTAGAHVVSKKNNGGKGAAIKDAFEYAKKVKADILVLIDGDGQHNPDEIPSLLAPIINGDADIVNGSRFLNNTKNHVPAYRRVGQEVLTLATNFGTKMHITDSQNGFRAFSKKSFECFTFKQNGMAIESEMLMDASKAKMRIREVPIDVRYDVNGSTYNPIMHGLSVLGRVISIISERRPLIFFCVPGAVLLFIGLMATFEMFDIFNITRNISVYYAMVSSSCVILGVTSIFTGFILNAIQGIK